MHYIQGEDMKLKHTVLPAAAALAVLGIGPEAAIRVMLGRNAAGQRIREKAMAKLEKRKSDPQDHMYRTGQYTALKNEENRQFLNEHPEERITVLSFDGLKLAGFIRRNRDTHRWLIAFHGYRADHTEIGRLLFSKEFDQLGFNVLAPDHRACGESEGNIIGMGWIERYDVLTWVNAVIEQDPDAEIVLFGESMGASSVLAAAGLHLPANVKAVIADSGFSSVSSIASHVVEKKYRLPSKTVIALCDDAAERYAGFTLSEADIAKELEHAEIPVLLLHGKQDSIVPFENFEILSSVQPKSQITAVSFEHADHVCSSLDEPERYWQTVRDFLKSIPM